MVNTYNLGCISSFVKTLQMPLIQTGKMTLLWILKKRQKLKKIIYMKSLQKEVKAAKQARLCVTF